MEITVSSKVERLAQNTQDAESSFTALLGSGNAVLNDMPTVYTALNRFCEAVEAFSHGDLGQSRKKAAEARLWNAHTQLHTLFKRRLKELRAESPTKPVEARKFVKSYLEFLKDGQRWYRAYIGKLNQWNGTIPELRQIVGDNSMAPDKRDPVQELHCLLSCYQALIALGDLARWRTTEKLDKEPTWGPAIGYYDLAIALRPGCGTAFNQRSIIASSERDHLRATYYLYRSVVAAEPFERGLDNLAVHMASLRKKWGTSEFSANPRSKSDAKSTALTAWFLRLHSMSFIGEPFKGSEELEAEVINRISAHIREPGSSGTLLKIAMINIAAERASLLRLKGAEEAKLSAIMQAFYSFQALNIRTFTILVERLGDLCTSPLPAPAAKILPVLRVYFQWLVATSAFLSPTSIDSKLEADATRMWQNVASTLDKLSAAFPVQGLPQLSYQLDEDEDVAGFEPLDSPETAFIRQHDDGTSKSKFGSLTQDRSPTTNEMMCRIRDLQIAGLRVAAHRDIPISLDNGRFRYGIDSQGQRLYQQGTKQAPVPIADSSFVQSTALTGGALAAGMRNQPSSSIRHEVSQSPHLQPPAQITEGQNSASAPLDRQEEIAMSMVDDLVGPEESPHPAKNRSSSLLENPLNDSTNVSHDRSPSFVPTPPTTRLARGDKFQHPPMFTENHRSNYSFGGLPSPLLFGNGGVWSTIPGQRRSGVDDTPPNGQGG